MEASFARLPDESWGVRIFPADGSLTGQTVEVQKRSGALDSIRLGATVMQGNKFTLYAVDRPGRKPLPEREIRVTEPGVYETPDDVVYIVKPNKAKTSLYAKRLVEINANRLTEADTRVQIEFEYEAGAIYNLTPEMKMPLERAKQLTIRYGRCIVCGAKLKQAESVERGIGPVCIKSFRS